MLCPQTVLLKAVSVCSCLLQETAARKKDLIKMEFSEIKALIEERENQALKVIADEEKRVCNKFDYVNGILGSKKKEIQSLTDQIEMALTEGDDILFLKVMCPVNANPVLYIARMQDGKILLWCPALRPGSQRVTQSCARTCYKWMY